MRKPEINAPRCAAVATGGPSHMLRGLALLCAGVSVMLILGVQGHGTARLNGAGSPPLFASGEAGVCVPRAVLLAERQQRARQLQRTLVAMQPVILPMGLALSASAGPVARAGGGAQQ